MIKRTPHMDSLQLQYNGRKFNIEYFYRQGDEETLVLFHGLGGAKENYYEACKSDALAGHTLLFFDNPGTGNSTYYNDVPLDVDDLAAISALFIDQFDLPEFILCGTSMGGLTTMLYLRGRGRSKVKAYINIEGNLMPEDCMFSGKVVTYDFDTFASEVFPDTIEEMKARKNTGYHMIANNLELNTNVKSYYNYSFQTVEYSATGKLLDQLIALTIPKIFIYGQKNRSLSYIRALLDNKMNVKEIPKSDHFIFYDNPKDLYQTMGDFVDGLQAMEED